MNYWHLLVPLFEIVIMTLVLNYLLKFFWGTRAMDVIFGFIAFLFLFVVATWFNFPVLEKIMLDVVNVAVLAVFISARVTSCPFKIAGEGKKIPRVS
jgi:diadenylate cyclase